MERLYYDLFEQHLSNYRQMIFIMGPRQAGKTTVAQKLVENNSSGFYFNWDNINDRDKIVKGPEEIAQAIDLGSLSSEKPLVAFDEIHKYKNWRDFLKGFYDSYPNQCHILVTGSAKLDVFSRGGDSLMGRYFPFHFHPLSVAEITQKGINSEHEFWQEPKPIDKDKFSSLLKFGGYPDPYLKQSDAFSRRWKKLRSQQLFSEDIRDLTRIQDIGRLEILAEKLKQQVGSLTSFQSLSTQLRVSDNTVRNWIDTLKTLYYCFSIRPWSKNVSRSLLKEPKYYLWDWSLCSDEGTRAENMVALHLLKAVHLWNDVGLGDYGLHFIRDKEKREVDFVVTKNNQPWMLIEVKLSNNKNISPSLKHFHLQLKPEFTLQVVLNMDYVQKSCFIKKNEIQIVPLKTFLAQLV
jgi:predicted AAA+ superfamily ATPase